MSGLDPDGPEVPDIQELADSMLLMYGGHDHDDEHTASDTAEDSSAGSGWAKARSFTEDPGRAAEIRAATGRDRNRYLNAGLTPVDCRRCGTTVSVKKLGPEYTAVQWNSAAARQCAHFAELRADGRDSNRSRSCPNLDASIRHAVAEGLLEETSSAPPPGDG
ncbi:MAG TPA: hypothetical protein VFR27_16630, partial [Mycobacterium sp.]|nr:hypothetical protein [Mycobacterium sp.]